MRRYWICLLLICSLIASCSKDGVVTQNPANEDKDSSGTSSDSSGNGNSNPTIGKIPPEVSPDIDIILRGEKISQLVGDSDREKKEPTKNRTLSTYRLKETDLGAPFRFEDRTYILFGDTHGGIPGNRDAIAYTTDTNPDDGLSLTFLHDNNKTWLPVTIPNVSLGAFEVPMEGVAVDHKMYIYATTNHSDRKTMGKSVLARSYDEGHTFDFISTLSSQHFINVSVVKTTSSDWNELPEGMHGKVLMMFGSGDYRASNVYLACQPAQKIEKKTSLRYFAGWNEEDKPIWVNQEKYAVPLFDQPQVGELSVTYNQFINRWVMLYNAGEPRGINMRTAKQPWGPWTSPQVIFDPSKDGGYGHFMHVKDSNDGLSDPDREGEWGGEYGPYQYGYLAIGDTAEKKSTTTIYFNMSTWNPYTVLLMKAQLKQK